MSGEVKVRRRSNLNQSELDIVVDEKLVKFSIIWRKESYQF